MLDLPPRACALARRVADAADAADAAGFPVNAYACVRARMCGLNRKSAASAASAAFLY